MHRATPRRRVLRASVEAFPILKPSGPGCAHQSCSCLKPWASGETIFRADMNDMNEMDKESKCRRGWFAHSAPSEADTLEAILHYLCNTAGYDIRVKPNVPMRESRHRRVGRAASEQEALCLLRQAAAGMGCTVLRKGRRLTVLTAHDAKKECVPLPALAE